MKSLFALVSLFAAWFLLPACGPTPPTEEALRAQLVGTYCADSYRLELTDSTYMNRKTVQSPLRSGMVRESCKGHYLLVFEDKQWIIRFEKDEHPNSIQNCGREYVVWTAEEGFVLGDAPMAMKDLFDETLLLKDACED
ncbi:MAG: hypothetical protein D6722_06190 [Bacteroidetes bacterium]|nr:MAG: hypothetical protein D6722_06190 [Bacteroidota bacterium]